MSLNQIQEVAAILGVFAIMLGLTYLKRYGLTHITAFYKDLAELVKLRKMDKAEHNILFDFVKEQRIFNKEIMDEVRTIKRGMYGDESNGSPGLIQRQAADETRIAKLEGFRNKLLWFTSGCIVIGQAGWELLKNKMDIGK